MNIEVVRAPGDRTGPTISDSLLTTDEAGRERGRVEIDRNCSGRELVDMTVPLAWQQPGGLAAMADADGGAWRGLVTGWRLTLSRESGSYSVESVVTFEREAL